MLICFYYGCYFFFFRCFFFFFFFFSSRRRHTRSKRDWSSDVCSSDLAARPGLALRQVEDADAVACLRGLRQRAAARQLDVVAVRRDRKKVHLLVHNRPPFSAVEGRGRGKGPFPGLSPFPGLFPVIRI